MAQPVEGYDPKQLEEDGDEVEAAVAAALVTAAAFVAAQVAVAIPGAVTPDMANIVRTIWNQLTARELTPKLADVIRRTADEIRSGIIAVVGPDLPGAVVDQITGVAVPDAPPVPIPTLNDVTAIDILSAASNRMRNIGDVLWQNIRAELVDGLAAGDGIPELADRVRAAAPLTEARARMVARTETIGASNGAAMAQARSTGLQMSKRWLATEDARTRPSHVAADGQTVALNEPFMVGIPVAGPLDFPGDPTGPASEIIQCRCSVLFLISSGANPFVASYGVPHLFTCLPPGDDHAPHPGPCKGWKRKPKAGDPAKDAPKSAPKSRKPAAGSKAERDQIARQLIIRMAAGERFDIKPDGVPDLMAALSAADAPPINLAQLHISGPGNENLFDRPLRDIPRENMPALPDNVPGLVPFIQGLSRMRDKNGNPIRVELVEIDPREIQATQSELSGPKVAKMAGFMKSGWKPGGAAIVSGENALLDGHHRWAGASVAALMYDQGVEGYSPVKMQVLRVDLPIDELLQIAEQFSGPKKGLGEKP